METSYVTPADRTWSGLPYGYRDGEDRDDAITANGRSNSCRGSANNTTGVSSAEPGPDEIDQRLTFLRLTSLSAGPCDRGTACRRWVERRTDAQDRMDHRTKATMGGNGERRVNRPDRKSVE